MTSATPHVPRPGQSNFAILAEEIAKRVATHQNASPTTIIGPPTSGTRVLNEFWRDAMGGEFRCTQASTPGTWIQIPKRLRIYFRFERRLLGEVCRAAARTVITVYRAASGRPDAVPGMVGAIQTSGRLIPVHPHVHALMAEGGLLARTRCFPAAGQAGHRAAPKARVWTPQRGLPV